MAKRGAEDQLTKDDVESGRGGRDDSDDENNLARDAPQEVIATRQIRGMPKRKGATATPAAPSASPFSFGQPSGSAAPAAGFGAPASSGFSFGSSTPAAPLASSATPARPSFGFGTAASAKTATSTGTSSIASHGFSFGNAAAAPTPASAPVDAPSTSAFSAPQTPKVQSKVEPAAKSNPFSSFAFAPATTTPTSKPPAAAPSAATTNTTTSSAFGAFGKSASTNTALAFGAPSAPVAPPKAVEPSPTSVKTPPSSATSQAKPEPPKEDQKEIEYLTSVRGLNESVVRALSVKIRDEPFVNLAAALESVKAEYNSYLEEIMKNAGKAVAANGAHGKKRDATAMDDSPSEAPPSKKATEAPKPAFVMPAPPVASTGGFKLPAPSASSSSTAANGFKPALPAVGGFKLPAAASTTAETSSPAAGGFKPTLPSTSAPAKASPFAGFSFGPVKPVETKDAAPTSAPAPASAPSASSVPFPTFGAPAPSSTGTTESTNDKRPSSRASIFAQGVIAEQAKEKAAEKEPPATPSAAQKTSSMFALKPSVKPAIGGTMVVPSPPASGGSSFLFKAPSTPSATASTTSGPLPTFSFNMGSTAGSTTTGAPGTPGTPGSPATFSFAAKPRSTSAAFGFGTAKGEAQNASGKTGVASTTPSQPPTSAFSFGASAPRALTSQPLFSAPSAATGTGDASKPIFSFGPTSTFAAPKAAAAVADSPAENTDSEEAPADAGPQADLTVGAGEEDEETLWRGKASVGTFGVWGESSAATWGDWKLCIVKLNKEKNPSGGAQPMRRIIARVDPSGAIVQNFSLRSLSDMAALTPTSYKLTVAGTDGIKQMVLRFGKIREGFDPTPTIEELKSAIRTEREAMGLPALPSFK